MDIKVSIIVPVYNKEKYLHKCIDSLVSQTYGNIEIILVDDESKDNSGAICDEYAKADDRIIVIHKENSGAAGAWRAGFTRATGQYVVFVDSDDWIDFDSVEKLVAHATGRDDEIIASDYIIERGDKGNTVVFQAYQGVEFGRTEVVNEVIPSMWGYEERRIHMSRCMKLISAKLIRDNEHYSRSGLRFGEDNALTLPLVMDCGRLYFLDHQPMYHYLSVEDSVVHGHDKTFMGSISLLMKLTDEMIEDKFSGDKAKEYPDGYADMLHKRIWLEWPFLLMFAIKNEIRGDKDTYIKNIRDICMETKNRDIIKNAKISVNHMSNKLVYFVMKHPSAINCMILRVAMRVR